MIHICIDTLCAKYVRLIVSGGKQEEEKEPDLNILLLIL